MTSRVNPNDESTVCDTQADNQQSLLESNKSTTTETGTTDAVATNQTSVTDNFAGKIATSANIQGYANTENNTPAGDDAKADPSTVSATTKDHGVTKSEQLAKKSDDTQSDSQSQNEQSSPATVVDHKNNDKHSNLDENIKPQETNEIDQNTNQETNKNIGQNGKSDDNSAKVTSVVTTNRSQSGNINDMDTSESISEIGSPGQGTQNSENLPFNQNSPPADENLHKKPTDTAEISPRKIEEGQPEDIEQKRKAQTQFQEAIDSDKLKNYKKFVYKIDQGKSWLNLQFHNQQQKSNIKKPHEIEVPDPPKWEGDLDADVLDRIKGSMIGMALGDALGAHVEFRPHDYLVSHPVKNLKGGGTWGLKKGQFTDDTSMALCLANSLIACRGFVPYDQLVRYKWWYKHGYMSSTGECFDIGNATRESIENFSSRQNQLAKNLKMTVDDVDYLNRKKLNDFDEYCSSDGVAGNGALMRLAPVPLFFYRSPKNAVEYSGISGQITHGDTKAYDACRYYGALIVAALHGFKKDQLLDNEFYSKYKSLFGEKELHKDIKKIAEGSYATKDGYDGNIRGKGYIVDALEAALWAFYSTGSFEKGALAAVNLGDDTDTTAAIYGQLAGAFYGYKHLPKEWTEHVYARNFLEKLSEWIAYEGDYWCKSSVASTE